MNHIAYVGIGNGNVKYEEGRYLAFSDTAKAVLYYDSLISKEYEYIKFSSLHYSPDSKHFVYAAQLKNSNWVVVFDGKEMKEYENISDLSFSSNSEHFAYGALSKNGWHVVFDSTELKGYLSIYRLTFSPDGNHFVYSALLSNKKWCVVFDGKESDEYDMIESFNFSSDSKHFAHIASINKNVFVVLDGKPQNKNQYTDIYPSTIKFSTDGSKLSYCAKSGNKWLMIIDGIEQMSNSGAPCASHFGLDNDVYYIGTIGSIFPKFYYFKNNTKVAKIPNLSTTELIFSVYGSYYAYMFDGRVFINGNGGPQYKQIDKLMFVSENAISYVAENKGKVYYIIEKIE